MRPSERGHAEVSVYCLHFLGGSAREWAAVEERLPTWIHLVGVDLPGFGDAVQSTDYSVARMASAVAGVIRMQRPDRWMLVGHSMGAKVLAALARRVEDGGERLSGLRGLITLAGSPPSPEPMDEAQRRTLAGFFLGGAESSRQEAIRFIEQNIASPVDPLLFEQTVVDVLRASRAAWVAWLDSGSREELTETVGTLRTPTVIVAGAEDPKLGPDAQHRLMAPHFAQHRLVVLPRAKHLLPLECAGEVADLILEHAISSVGSTSVSA